MHLAISHSVKYVVLREICRRIIHFITHPQENGGVSLQGGPVDALIAYAASSTKAGEKQSNL